MDTKIAIFGQPMALATLFVPGSADPLITRIREEVMKEIVDPSTPDGRKRIVALAFKVTKTKTAIEDARKALVADEKRRLAAIDAEGRRIREELDALADVVRQPVTEFEEREARRIAGHETRVEGIKALGRLDTPMAADQIAERLAVADAVSLEGFEEFTAIATTTKAQVVEVLSISLAAARKADAERAELERLRKEAAEREQREREEAAAAKARAEAEAEAKRREEEAARAAEQERLRIQREAEEREAAIRAEAEAKEKAAAEAAAQVKREKEEAEARAAMAEADKLESERRAKEAAEQAERDRIAAEVAATERERQRIDAERKAEHEARMNREADDAHRAAIDNKAVAGLNAAGLDDDTAKHVIVAIALGHVPHVRIEY